MENINENIEEKVDTLNVQNAHHHRGRQCGPNRNVVAGERGIDSSLLFFFLLLVIIVCQSDCDISMDTLLWFFLLLVVIYNQYY